MKVDQIRSPESLGLEGNLAKEVETALSDFPGSTRPCSESEGGGSLRTHSSVVSGP